MSVNYALPQGVIENINALEESELWELIEVSAFAAKNNGFASSDLLRLTFVHCSDSISDDTLRFIANDQIASGFLVQLVANLIERRKSLFGQGNVTFDGEDLVEATYSTSPITAETDKEVADKEETPRHEIVQALQSIERVEAEEAEVQDTEDPYGDDDQ